MTLFDVPKNTELDDFARRIDLFYTNLAYDTSGVDEGDTAGDILSQYDADFSPQTQLALCCGYAIADIAFARYCNVKSMTCVDKSQDAIKKVDITNSESLKVIVERSDYIDYLKKASQCGLTYDVITLFAVNSILQFKHELLVLIEHALPVLNVGGFILIYNHGADDLVLEDTDQYQAFIHNPGVLLIRKK